MKTKYLQEILVTVLLIGLLLFFVNPLDFWMPSDTELMIVCGLIVVYIAATSYLWKESARDERESEHRMRAGHISYIVGTAMLLTGIVSQHFTSGMIDQWLVYALAAMVIAKVIARIYSDRYK